MRDFDPGDWYWKADDGRVFASARREIVDEEDEVYLAWAAHGGHPTRWPLDDDEEQSIAALQAVLQPYGLWADLAAYAADRRWRFEIGGTKVGGMSIATDDRSKAMILGARLRAMADPDYEERWKTEGGQFVLVAAPQIIAISDAVAAHVSSAFAIEASLVAAIEAGTVTEWDEVDAAFAAESASPG